MPMSLSASLLRSVSTVRCRVVAVVGGRGGPIARPFGSVAAPTTTVAPPLLLPRRSLARTLSSSRTDEAVSMPTDVGAVADAGMDVVQRRLMFSLFFFLPRLISPEIGRRQSKLTITAQQWLATIEIDCYRPISDGNGAETAPISGTAHAYRSIAHQVLFLRVNYPGVRNAAQRKLLDELGIPPEDLPVDEFIPLGRILYKAASDGKWGEHELDYLLFIVRDVNLHPNPDEVADVKYVNREQLKEVLRKADAGEDGVKLSPWFRLVVDTFLPKWWDHVERGTLQETADMETIHKLT
ncbi:hypothetical protein BHM03_00012332 [Ensete ventricosum]|nr:hypothetical protein BHM03_00012332 [Ensete ventricosum]